MDRQLRKTIIDFLAPLLCMAAETDRRGVLIAAGLDTLKTGTDVSGSTRNAVTLLVDALEHHDPIEGKSALVLFLQEVAERTGNREQAKAFCDQLTAEAKAATPTEPGAESEKSDPTTDQAVTPASSATSTHPGFSLAFLVVTALLAAGLTLGLCLWLRSAPQLGEPVDLARWSVSYLRPGGTTKPAPSELRRNPIDPTRTALVVPQADLISKQAPEGWTASQQSLVFRWELPYRVVPATFSAPYSGILATIRITPQPGYESAHIFCAFRAEYVLNRANTTTYASSAKFVPFNQPTLLIWDFTGSFSPGPRFAWHANYTSLLNVIQRDDYQYTDLASQIPELSLYEAVSNLRGETLATDWRDDVKSLELVCRVSRHELYDNADPADLTTETVFYGEVAISDVRVVIADFPGLRPQ